MATAIVLLFCLVAGGLMHLYQVLTLIAWLGRSSRHETVARAWTHALSSCEALPLVESYRDQSTGDRFVPLGQEPEAMNIAHNASPNQPRDERPVVGEGSMRSVAG